MHGIYLFFVLINTLNPDIPIWINNNKSNFIPKSYGDADVIEFSNGIAIDTKALSNFDRLDINTFEPDYYIIQFSGAIYETHKQQLERLGIKIHFYIPHYAFVCRINDPVILMELNSDPDIKFIALYQSDYKISSLFEKINNEHVVTFLLFLDSDINETLEQIKTITGQNDFTISDNGINKIIQGNIDTKHINQLARIKSIYWIEPYFQPESMNQQFQWVVQTGWRATEPTGNDLVSRRIWGMGIAGQGEILHHTDAGINTYHFAHRSGSPAITTWGYYPDHNAIVAYDSGAILGITFGDDGSYHGTATAGTLSGDDTTHTTSYYDGVAKRARIYHCDCAGLEPVLYLFRDLNELFWRPYYKYYPPTRAHISTISWGSSTVGAYTAMCQQVDQFTWWQKDFLVFASAGNSGGIGTVGSPASAKSCVAVGGTRNSTSCRTYYTTTSRGPTADGRLKPTVLAPAMGIISPMAGSTGYSTPLSGTSLAAPGAAASAGLIRQYLREGWYPTGTKQLANSLHYISASLLKAMLINCGDSNITGYQSPDNNVGWGRVDLDSTLYFAGDQRKLLLIDENTGLFTGEQIDYQFRIPANTQNLKIALVWTDYPGNPAVLRQIVNDLDLEINIGTNYYRGNQYLGTRSIPNPANWDSINVEECIRINTPDSGICLVKVRARNVPYGPQPFSLVVTFAAGDIPSLITLNKAVYRLNDFITDTVRIRVEDSNYGSINNIDSLFVEIHGVKIETQPETIWCYELAESAYVFIGEVPLYFNKAIHGDNRLSAGQGDTIIARYEDNYPIHELFANAIIDAYYFTITDVHADSIEATRVKVHWLTNEAANQKVYYGTNPDSLNQTCENDSIYTNNHSLVLSGLSDNTIYYYDVESWDFRNNMVLDNNNGRHYSFSTKKYNATDILVVVLNNNLGGEEFAHPEFLTDALEASGWTYDWWSTRHDGQFSRNHLKWYKAVFFQIGQENYPVWTVAQKESIKLYHDGGARFAITGHDIGWDPWQYSPSADTNFCKDNLHFRYRGDITSTSWNTLYGMPGDPISGDYLPGAPIPPFRQGAAGDSILLSGTGAPGIGSYVWHGSAAGDSCGIKWISQNPMGTIGDGVWGGNSTRVVTNAFEITQIDTIDPNSPYRIDIINKMFIWLIGHNHPDVVIDSPVGGNIYTTNPITISWTVIVHDSAEIDTTTLEYTSDNGSTWLLITSGTNITSPYYWDVSSFTNGIYYKVRVRVKERNIYPALQHTDETDRFSIIIPGNDFLGPKIIPLSIMVSANPMIVTPTDTILTFTAIASDSMTGLSNIGKAEWSMGSNPALPGSGYPAYALDSIFNEIQETITDSIFFIYVPGSQQVCSLWVRARDLVVNNNHNWGNALLRTFTVVDGIPILLGASEFNKQKPMTVYFANPQPNPFSKKVTLRYGLPKRSNVILKVYNCLGQVVKTFIDGTVDAGNYAIQWQGQDQHDRQLSSGIYFIRFICNDYQITRKIVFVR